MFGVQLDRVNNQVESICAVDFARYAVGMAWRETKAFGEVEQAIHALRVAVEHEEHRTGARFRP